MIRPGIRSAGRLAAVALAVAFVLTLAGDRGRAATVPAVVNGQDPLEVLALKVRPNVVLVLDSSGSMTSSMINTQTSSGDHPRSKMSQAKQVLVPFVTNNQNKASFLFGTYSQTGSKLSSSAGGSRFVYYTTSTDSPSMTTTQLVVTGDNAQADRGVQAWMDIRAGWNTLYFDEDASGGGSVDASVCTATVAPGFYRDGSDLASALQAAMNSASCSSGSRTNTYNVVFNTGSGRFEFSRASGSRYWRIRWSQTPNSIRGAVGRRGTGTTGWNTTGTYNTSSSYRLFYSTNSFTETVAGSPVTYYQFTAGRLWNGETIRVQADGRVCGWTAATAVDMTNPATVKLQQVSSGCGSDVGSPVTLTFGGGSFGGNGISCRGFGERVALVPCDLISPPAPLQIDTIGPWIENELTNDPFNVDGTLKDYAEDSDGSWAATTVPPETITVAGQTLPRGGVKADGWTPLGNTLEDIKGVLNCPGSAAGCLPDPFLSNDVCLDAAGNDIKCPERVFSKLWNSGQSGATSMSGPAPWQLDPIKDHLDPKEKTIVILVTDGDDTCPNRSDGTGSQGDLNALRAAHKAQKLFTPLDPAEPASSVQTFVVGFGGAFTAGEPTRLNWIAWGGSGLGQGLPGQPAVSVVRETNDYDGDGDNDMDDYRWDGTTNQLKALRARCRTCQDAFVAPDADTLAAQLQAIIDQGAAEGEFNAQQSITESVFEYVDLATTSTDVYYPDAPANRYSAIVPTRVLSSFTLPGFDGQVKAYQGDAFGNTVLKWSAGGVLWKLVSDGLLAACAPDPTTGASAGECSFAQLHGGATDATIATSGAAIKRRIYTTDRNGVFPFDAASLIAGTASNRVALWPPTSAVAPADYTTEGIFDAEVGLPLDTTADAAGDLATLQRQFGACVGDNLPSDCTGGSTLDQMKAARREARDMILAFMAGAESIDDANGPKRAVASSGSVSQSDLLFEARPWILGDSELATAAIVTQPLPSEPEQFTEEYKLFRDGPRDGSTNKNTDSAGQQIYEGFGLRSPDNDGTVGITVDTSVTPNITIGEIDTRTALKPVMTVVYTPANDMLHAFRAGPNVSPSTSCDEIASPATDECGGQELWGFVPYDQLNALRLRVVNDPQGQDNHVFMLARGVRFSDVFVASDTPLTISPGGVNTYTVQGVWRRILYVARGIGGKYVTALDITAPGPYTVKALATQGPIPLWNRGNPDTQDGTATGPDNNTAADRLAYAGMGETWSMPSIAYVDRANPLYQTARRPGGLDYVIYMGSGYGAAGEGTTFYTLDALSGDVVASVDVEAAAAANGLTRTTLSYPNALVANPVGFNPGIYSLLSTVHPAAAKVTRVYFGDIHGRLWKVLAAVPDVAIPIADLGVDQPVGTAASLLGMPPAPDVPIPHIYVVSGNERRADGPFKMFGFRDDGTDTDTTVAGTSTAAGVTTFAPAVLLDDPATGLPFVRTFDQGVPDADCGYTEEAVFRGTLQPATAFECGSITIGTCQDPVGRVFFGGTRLSAPNTRFAPPTPLACGIGDYPCRSTFDSIIYALGAKTGLAAYDLNASGDDAYRIYRDSRIAAISMLADPDPSRGGSSFTPDEGQMKGTPKPPPPPGVPPTSTSATFNVTMVREPGQPPPSVRYGSTVCQ